MQQVLIVHLLKNGFGLQVCGQVEEHLEWQVASQSELGVPLREPSSHWFCQLFIQTSWVSLTHFFSWIFVAISTFRRGRVARLAVC
jgi:hypothetical protein